MNKNFKPNTNEDAMMIVLGIFALILLVFGFILYLFFLHKITLTATIISSLICILIYIPRLLIIKKLYSKDKITILDDSIKINNQTYDLAEIQDFKVKEQKPQVIFFLMNNMIVFQEATFYLKLNNGQTSFTAIGSEKIKLLKEFFTELLNNKTRY